MFTTFLCLTLLMGGGSPLAAAGVCRKVDEVHDLPCEDVQARLDAYGVSLYDEPGSRGYIVFYEGKYWGGVAPRRGAAFAETSGYKDYLVSVRRVEPGRVVLINGGYREDFTAQFFICPGGAALPPGAPTLKESEVKFRRGKVPRERHRWCCGCL